MFSIQEVAVFVLCCFLHVTFTAGLHSGTKFTKEPPSKVYAIMGSDVMFQWDLNFGNFDDYRTLTQIYWGKTYGNSHIANKYITVDKTWRTIPNPELDKSVKSRVSWIGNVTQQVCKQVFILRNVSKADETTYGCTADVDGYDIRSGPIKLFVRDPVPPTFTKLSNATVDADGGDDLEVHCEASGDPLPSVSWIKDRKRLQNGSSSHVLKIPKIKRSDAGTYTCTATNQAGSVSHSVLVKVVRYKPQVLKTASSKPLIKSWINHVTILKCAVDAKPEASLTWFKDGQRIVEGANSTHDVSTLTLTPKTAGDFGLYSCNATNSKGTARHFIKIYQLYPPGAPFINKVTPDVLKSNVTWSKNQVKNSSRILDFMITLLDANRRVLQRHNGIRSTFYTLENLQQNRTYMLMLQARNIAGYGTSANVTFTTLEGDPPEPPKIQVVPNVLSLNVTWFSSFENNGIGILDYLIKVVDYVSLRLVQEYKRVTRTSLVIGKLKKNTTYFVAIQARNEVGYGRPSNVSATTLLTGPPDAPLVTNITVSGKKCSLQWREPYNGQSSITMYKVYVWVFVARRRSYSKERLNSWNTTEHSYTLELDWDQKYTIAVSAWNKYGESSPLLERHFRTDQAPKVPSSNAESTEATSTITPLFTKTQEVISTERTEESLTEFPSERRVGTRESRKGSVAYYAPIWFVLLSFAIPVAVYVFWKIAKKKIITCCCKSECRCKDQTQFENDSELSNTSYLSRIEELKETTVSNQYESITDVFATNLNLGYSIEDEKSKYSGSPVTHNHCYDPEGTSIYNHLNEVHASPASKKLESMKEPCLDDMLGPENGQLKTGLGMFDNQMYSHLIHGESPVFGFKRSPLPETSFILPPPRQWEVSRDRLRIESTIGHGEFGLVKKGLALDVTSEGGWVVVAVKTIKENANETHHKDLLSELKVMKELSPHKHVVRLLACVTKTEPLCVITEFAPYGDLLGFLRKKRGLRDNYYDTEQLPDRNLSSQLLMKFAWEIADGMAHLSAAKVIHRDLAARNVLLGENLTCKVTDFGMARNTNGQDIYQRTSEGRLPFKWTALESLEHGCYTTKSDVWSFGVVLYEIFTIGGSPYSGMKVAELTEKLQDGYRLEKPKHLHKKVYDLMHSCWNKDPEKRLTFGQLYRNLKQLDKEVQDCINLRTYNGKLYENFEVFKK